MARCVFCWMRRRCAESSSLTGTLTRSGSSRGGLRFFDGTGAILLKASVAFDTYWETLVNTAAECRKMDEVPVRY